MMLAQFKLFKRDIEFTFRYRYDKNDPKLKFIWQHDEWRISFFYKKQAASKLKTERLLGFEFLVIKSWFKF